MSVKLVDELILRSETKALIVGTEDGLRRNLKVFMEKYNQLKALTSDLKQLAIDIYVQSKGVCKERCGNSGDSPPEQEFEVCAPCELMPFCQPLSFVFETHPE